MSGYVPLPSRLYIYIYIYTAELLVFTFVTNNYTQHAVGRLVRRASGRSSCARQDAVKKGKPKPAPKPSGTAKLRVLAFATSNYTQDGCGQPRSQATAVTAAVNAQVRTVKQQAIEDAASMGSELRLSRSQR